MAATHLTARFCAAAQPKTGKDGKPVQTAYYDDDPRGLELRVSGDGKKVWSYRYRTLAGVQRRLTVGTFVAGDDEPEVDGPVSGPRPLTLKAARRLARQARAVVESGGDPAATKRADQAKARAEPIKTFNDLADAFLADSERGHWKPRKRQKRSRTIADETAVLKRYVRPSFGGERPESIDRRAVRKLLAEMIDRGIGAQTNRTLAVVRQVFAYGVDRERVTANPAAGLDKPATENARGRVLSDAELKKLWTICETAPEELWTAQTDTAPKRRVYVTRPLRIALQLCALLLCRRNEVAGMQVAELDLDHATWLIPGERMKGAVPHLVPLPPRAVELIKEAMALARGDEPEQPPVVFPSPRNKDKPIHPDTLSHAMSDLRSVVGIENITPHDLRRTGSTAMTSERLGISPLIRSKVLAHISDTGGGASVSSTHYDANSYVAEKRRALEAWGSLLRKVVGEAVTPPGPLPQRSAQ